MIDAHLQSSRSILASECLLEFRYKLGSVSADVDSLVGQSLEALHLLHGLFGDATRLRVGNGLSIDLQSGKEKGEEGSGIDGIVDKLGHVVDNDSGLTLGGGGLLPQSTKEEGHDHGQSGRFHALHEGDSRHLVHDLRHLLGFGNSRQNLLRHVFNVLVANDLKRLSHGLGGGLLDLLLGVPHARRNFGHDLGKGITELLGRGLSEEGEALEGRFADLPLLLDGKLGEDDGEEGLHGEGVDAFADGDGGFGGGLGDGLRFVAGLFDACREAVLDDGLAFRGSFGEGLDEGDSGEGRFLVLRFGLGGEGVDVCRESRLFDAIRLHRFHQRGLVTERQLFQLCFN
mmetsp:Transcript_13784/g.22476  ORF Transcript_13784/g.22476 Transcript_13784/m.22476 type:complete len:343 (-) Transcript_13784:67-1095(-)